MNKTTPILTFFFPTKNAYLQSVVRKQSISNKDEFVGHPMLESLAKAFVYFLGFLTIAHGDSAEPL